MGGLCEISFVKIQVRGVLKPYCLKARPDGACLEYQLPESVRQEELKFKTNLGNLLSPCLQIKKYRVPGNEIWWHSTHLTHEHLVSISRTALPTPPPSPKVKNPQSSQPSPGFPGPAEVSVTECQGCGSLLVHLLGLGCHMPPPAGVELLLRSEHYTLTTK